MEDVKTSGTINFSAFKIRMLLIRTKLPNFRTSVEVLLWKITIDSFPDIILKTVGRRRWGGGEGGEEGEEAGAGRIT